ncbi:MAG: DNA polymerase III subunit delta [candidate division WOR-3 bacterium]
MNIKELKAQLDAKKIAKQYLLVGNEPSMITDAIGMIKSAISVNESFDYEVLTLTESTPEEIVSRLYTIPFASSRRMVVVKQLEEMEKGELINFAQLVRNLPDSCCLVMTYQLDKEMGFKKINEVQQKIFSAFPNAQHIFLMPDKKYIHDLLTTKLNQMKFNIPSDLIQYLEAEFSKDLLGLENELLKIKNYLCEAKKIPHGFSGDFIKGVSDYNKYAVARAFLDGKPEVLRRFEEIKPYLQSPAEVIDALVRVTNSSVQKKEIRNFRAEILDELSRIDHRIKIGSIFADILLEIFLIRNRVNFRKEVKYG